MFEANDTRMGEPNASEGGCELAPGVFVDPGVVQVDFVASSGPGGQNVNKRATKAQLRITLSDIPIGAGARSRLRTLAGSRLTSDGVLVIAADEHRSQRRNREACFERLRHLLIEALTPPKPRKPTRTPKWAVRKRLDEKKRTGERKRDRRKPDASG